MKLFVSMFVLMFSLVSSTNAQTYGNQNAALPYCTGWATANAVVEMTGSGTLSGEFVQTATFVYVGTKSGGVRAEQAAIVACSKGVCTTKLFGVTDYLRWRLSGKFPEAAVNDAMTRRPASWVRMESAAQVAKILSDTTKPSAGVFGCPIPNTVGWDSSEVITAAMFNPAHKDVWHAYTVTRVLPNGNFEIVDPRNISVKIKELEPAALDEIIQYGLSYDAVKSQTALFIGLQK